MSDREAFEKWAKWRGYNTKWYITQYDDPRVEYAYQAWQAAQAQASKPIAAVHGWFHGECVIRPLDPEAVLPAGMALYSQPQAQAGDGEAVGWQYQHEDTGRTTFVSHAEASEFEELNSRRWHKTIQLYAAPPAAVNQQLTLGDLNTIRQWHNAIKDAYVNYLEEQDAAVFAKIEAAIAAAQDATPSAVPVNQQLLEALLDIERDLDLAVKNGGSFAAYLIDKARAAIAAAQEQSK